MTLIELNDYFNSFLHYENFKSDPSQNGLQIQNSDPAKKPIKKVGFAVDACFDTLKIAAQKNCNALFVHHGLFWEDCQKITAAVYARYKVCFDNDLALFGVHVPLDANDPYGNNYGLAARLGMTNLTPFGTWREMVLGVKGELTTSLNVDEITKKLLTGDQKPLCILPFGKKEITTVGIISGGGGGDVYQAIDEKLDCYVTGVIEHELFHYIKENNINAVSLGHYNSETVGVQLVAKKLTQETGIESIFIDVPTNL